jgi:hypothetical protein
MRRSESLGESNSDLLEIVFHSYILVWIINLLHVTMIPKLHLENYNEQHLKKKMEGFWNGAIVRVIENS